MSADELCPRLAVSPLIDGQLVESESEIAFEVINPSNGRFLMEIPRGCEIDVDRAVISSRRAFEQGQWSDSPPSFRSGRR